MLIIATSNEASSCGIVIYRNSEDGLEVLLAKQKNRKFWELPKGRSKTGETSEETAKREVEEEVGIVADDLESLCTLSRKKRKYYFFCAEKDEVPNVAQKNEDGIQEFSKAKYFPAKKALTKIVQWQKPCLEELIVKLSPQDSPKK